MNSRFSYKIFFISEFAATIDFGNVIDEEINKTVIGLFRQLCQVPLLGMIEVIPGYSSLTVYFDLTTLRKKILPRQKIDKWILDELNKQLQNDPSDLPEEKNVIRIPVCYQNDFAIDLHWMSKEKRMPAEEIILSHHSKRYRVYMLGFLPGFAYMAEVDERIATPRKPQPQPIPAGSVGIAGRQTGIYPFNSPGGWRIIGRTPLKMFDDNKLCLLKAGDYVEFYPITKNEFKDY
ncbi:MAG: hypothetical protein C5B54_06425 [Acidobacteria bacterium]|nr:MAG: hypothetical protein C5B54_06425 [Acidobacteriota bacterium]